MTTPVWINLDLFLAEVIARNLRDYIDNSAGSPGEYTDEQWNAKLSGITTKLEAYLNRFDILDAAKEAFVVSQAKEAMHDLADIFPALWD